MQFWFEIPKGKDHSRDLGVGWGDIKVVPKDKIVLDLVWI
jgi:hypothetical protein